MDTYKVDRCLTVSLTVAYIPAPLLNLDPFNHRKVTQANDLMVFNSPLGCWIYAKITSAKSYFGRIRMLNH
jgi:hypothetical protein